MLASVVMVASTVLVLALLGLPRRGSVGPGPAGGAEFRFVLPAGTPDFL